MLLVRFAVVLAVGACLAAPVAGGDAFDELLPKPIRVERAPGTLASGKVTVSRAPVDGAPKLVRDQAYVLDIRPDGVRIVAGGSAGERYAHVTLEQLGRLSGGNVPCGKVVDWPSLKWRGYMNDCGRNYLEVEGVKAMIDIMGRYKYNLFHWHLSDYHGWRLESRKYPQLQDRKAFLRQVGKYYTQDEFREIVRYASERGVTVMPELDVPGHTLAFRRGMGIETMDVPWVGKVVAELIEELCSLAPAEVMPFIHLGTDEVRVKPEYCDKTWPTMWARTVNACGRTAVLWAPGEKVDPGCKVIDMAWHDDRITNTANRVFDSARMYNAGWGPCDVVPNAAYIKACRWDTGDDRQIGAITCTWHDDNVGDDTLKLFRECMVFPAMVAMADNFWSGRAEDNHELAVRMPSPADPRFKLAVDLEDRMVAQRDKALAGFPYPFPFVRQTGMRWRLTDERTGKVIATDIAQAALRIWHVNGKTPLFMPGPKGDVTAEMWIKSPADQTVGAWIDFTDYNGVYGRLNDECTPLRGEWSKFGASVEVNGRSVPPPEWRQPGMKSVTKSVKDQDVPYSTDLLEKQMLDELPTLRAPTPIHLKKGWNHVKLRIPHDRPQMSKIWKGMFCLLDGTSEHPREVPGLEYSSHGPAENSSSCAGNLQIF